MSGFIKYQHVERLGKTETEGLLQNKRLFITSKIDGTNGSIWYDRKNDRIACGSRGRELSVDKDNAGFYNWLHTSDNAEVQKLIDFISDYKNLIVYGEWTGAEGGKFVGAIKDYVPYALGTFYIFDVYDTDTGLYLSDDEWRRMLASYDLEPYFTQVLSIVDYPTMDDIVDIAKRNKFLLDNANHPGEGVVIKCADWRNKYGRQQYGKLVLDEYKQVQKASRKQVTIENIEEWIVERYCTDAEIAKAIAKVEVECGADFDNHQGKHIGMLLNLVWTDSILEEMKDILKKGKNPTINFAVLKNKVDNKVKEYAGIGR